MELEKDYVEVLGMIERLKRESLCSRCVENLFKIFKEVNNSMDWEMSVNYCEGFLFGNLFWRFGDVKCDLFFYNDKILDCF